MVNPPAGSPYHPRRVRLTLGAQSGMEVAYTVTALDGEPVSVPGGQTIITGTALLPPGPAALAALGFRISVFRDGGVQIAKTGDQATAQPGDTVIYRVSVNNSVRPDAHDAPCHGHPAAAALISATPRCAP